MATVVYGPWVLFVIWAITETIGPQRCSSMSKPWHWVSISCACGWVPKFGSPPKRQAANTISPSWPALQRCAGPDDWLGVAMVEVDREEGAMRRCLVEKLVRFVEMEDQRLLDKQRDAGFDELEGRLEMVLVGQAHGDQIGLLGVEHFGDARVAVGVVKRRLGAWCGPDRVRRWRRARYPVCR